MELLEFTDIKQVQRYIEAIPIVCDFFENKLKFPMWISYYLAKAIAIIYAISDILIFLIIVIAVAAIIYKRSQYINPKKKKDPPRR